MKLCFIQYPEPQATEATDWNWKGTDQRLTELAWEPKLEIGPEILAGSQPEPDQKGHRCHLASYIAALVW